jgi:flagellar motor switch protein FliN/FliY
MTNQLADRNHRPFSDAFFAALVRAITEATGSPWLVAAMPDAESTADDAEPVRINLRLDGSLRGEFLLEFRQGDVAMLASMCLRESPAEFGGEQSQALLKMVEAGAGEFRSVSEQEYGAFTIETSLASAPVSDRTNVIEITAADDGGNRLSMRVYLNPALSEALSLHIQTHGPAKAKGQSVNTAGANFGSAPSEQVNLQLVLDVELNVTLRFGQRQLALREVLELTSGSVIELDRQVEEPVELLLEGKVIARGEAVVIDGNYGLRVTEVPQPVSPPVLR